MSSKELTAPLGVGVPTASSKSTIIKKTLKINYYQVDWSLSSVIENNLFESRMCLLYTIKLKDGIYFQKNLK